VLRNLFSLTGTLHNLHKLGGTPGPKMLTRKRKIKCKGTASI